MTTPARPAPTKRPNGVLAVLLLAGASFALSQTVVIPALPAIAGDLEASTSATSWVLTGFLLSASVATPIVGKLGDLYGKGRVLTAVLVAFSLGGTVSALAPSIEVLVAGRMAQGVAGGVFPLAYGIIRDTFPPERVPTGLSLISAIFGIGGGIGLPLSGLIVDNADSSWLFWISLVALPAALAAYRVVPVCRTTEQARIDWVGAVLLSAALGAMLLGVTQAESWGWGSPGNVGLIASGLALAALWVAVEARVDQPLIELQVLRERAVATTNATALLVGLGMFSSFLLIPQLAETPESTGYGLGTSVTTAGLLLMPSALVQLLAGPLVGRLGTRIGFRLTLAAGGLLSSAAFVLLAVAHSSAWEIVVAGVLLGAGIAFAFASMANLVVAAAPQSQIGIATGINTVMRTVGGAFGAAIATAILATNTPTGSVFPTEGAYVAAFSCSAVVGLLACAMALLVPRHVEESGRARGESYAVAD